MNGSIASRIPHLYSEIEERTKKVEFDMPSDQSVGSLLRTLVASKPNGRFLEIGTGTGLALSWILDGMNARSEVISIDNNPELIEVASEAFVGYNRVQLVCADGKQWIKQYEGGKFDVIFADSWPGKYSAIDETLNLLKLGGFYVIDDMMFQSNWPEGHQQKAETLTDYLENREDLYLTKMNWSTGIIIATKI
ncbi:methyltransferase domain-containing protein [Tunicatimonas pelagia]|nr:methyltransferase domain-containing protein [Tunicatimonas pelagia]WKN46396.1 methyltransferase domain-containing protein [Tunicatimonas pelagia]